jgi:ubiquinone/menaquinone biosynthesis C-methylase UbiE
MQKEAISISEYKLKDYLQWDIFIWGKALLFWSKVLETKNISNCLALEIGSKNGGLSLYLANEFKLKVICSDLKKPDTAKDLHKKYNIGENIQYASADAIDLNFESNTFDIVIFKSVLGTIGKDNYYEKQIKALNEMNRVLKDGGILLFAENAKASFLHSFFRKIFRRWGNYWRYITPDEMSNMLKKFSKKEIYTAGFLSAFVPLKMKKLVLPLDNFIEKIVPKNSRYIVYGYAVK